MVKNAFRIVLLCLALSTSWVMAQSEPSMAEVYAAAQAGQLDKAQTMIQQVLVSHPNSAKAHYVRAELWAREGKAGAGVLARGRTALTRLAFRQA